MPTKITIRDSGPLLIDGDITLSAIGSKGEVQVEESNDFDATSDITLVAGPGILDGKLNVKVFTDLDAGVKLTLNSGGECKIEAATSGWTPPPMLLGAC